ncbi:MAG: hypothetical protein WCT45_02640 [Candidatus Paceibacterota bacterium]|jgi:hypothetical protein
MGIEGGYERREGDTELSFESIVNSFHDNVQALDAFLEAEGGALPPERQEEVRALQDKILKLHATAF